MTLFALLAVLAVFCVAFLGASYLIDGINGVDPAPPDRSPRGELPDGPITPEHLGALKFSLAFRGYRMAEVDAVLARLADQLAARDAASGPVDPTPSDEA